MTKEQFNDQPTLKIISFFVNTIFFIDLVGEQVFKTVENITFYEKAHGTAKRNKFFRPTIFFNLEPGVGKPTFFTDQP